MRQTLERLLNYKLPRDARQLIADAIEADNVERNRIRFTRVNSDVNGNPRYVAHFLQCAPRAWLDAPEPVSYQAVINLMRKIGGRKYHNKQYGGGIVFQGDTAEIERNIKEVLNGLV